MVLFLISFVEEVRIFQKKEEVGSLPGKFQKVPWYFFVLSFAEEVDGGNFEKLRKVSICSIKQDLLPQIFVCQRQLYFPSRFNVINGHG